MQQAYVVTGQLIDGQTVKLDEALPMRIGNVRVVVAEVEIAPEPRKLTHHEVLAMIHQRQIERGHVAPTREEVDAYLKAERESWDD